MSIAIRGPVRSTTAHRGSSYANPNSLLLSPSRLGRGGWLVAAQRRSGSSIQSPSHLDAAAPDPDLATGLQPRPCAPALGPLRRPPLLSP
jgi:hypothetical protein